MRGRKAKPTAIKVVTGNPGKRALPKNEPKPKNRLAAAPVWMSDEQRAIWEYGLREAPAGVLTAIDYAIYTVYVVAVAAHQTAALRCAEDGTVIETKQGNVIQAPWVGLMNRQAAVIIRACAELGFTPSSRSRVSVEDDGDDSEADPAAKYFQ